MRFLRAEHFRQEIMADRLREELPLGCVLDRVEPRCDDQYSDGKSAERSQAA